MSSETEAIHSKLMANYVALSKIDFDAVNTHHSRLEMFDTEIEKLEQARDAEIDKFCAECPHPKEFLAVAPYKSSTFFDSMPIRICKLCGGSEEGWRYYFIVPSVKPDHTEYVSDDDLSKISRDDLFKLRRKIYQKGD